MSKYSRRKFIGSVPCMALGSTTLFSSLINLKSMANLVSTNAFGGDDYRALVCVMLRGGNDSYNMLIPRSDAEYNEYAQVRTNQAIPQNEILPISPLTNDGRDFGLHPSMTGLQQLFENGKAAFISNVGTLVEPVTDKTEVYNETKQLPLGLYSHIDQVMHWQTAMPQDRTDQGWGGRMADILKSENTNNDISMNISLAGNNIFQRGDTVLEYAINNDEGGVAIAGWDLPLPFFNIMREDISDGLNKSYEDIFKDAYAGTMKTSIESTEVFNAAIAAVPSLNTEFDDDSRLSQDFKMVANTIAARDTLGSKRQIFFLEIGGFDNHDELLGNHAALMANVDRAFSQFYAATEELGIADCVTTFTISDFSRTLLSNGNGTDHAWGGNAIIMGGSVKGKDMYGTYPSLALNTSLELGGGVLLPTTSADLYFAELALWFGISPNDLHLILPNLSNFYSYDPNSLPLDLFI